MIGLRIFKEYGPTQVLSGIWLVALTAMAAIYAANIPVVKGLGLSPLLLAILIGLFYGNTLSSQLPNGWVHGVRYCTSYILRLAIILLGFSFTFQEIAKQGMLGVIADSIIVICTLLMGYFIGTRLLKMDPEMSLMCSIGPAICGASAVLAAESVLRTSHAKTAVAVSTVVLFGTISMFLYPSIYFFLPHNLSDTSFGIYIGSSVHEVPQVIAAGNVISADVAQTSTIVKMTRVLMLVPVLLITGFIWGKIRMPIPDGNRREHSGIIPWWAFIFVGAVALNSMISIQQSIISSIHSLDIFLLTMAMGAIGMETTVAKFKEVGGKPFVLTFILFVWLVLGGWVIAHYLE
ncbi:MAG: YeiH family protein [Gallionella sp.]